MRWGAVKKHQKAAGVHSLGARGHVTPAAGGSRVQDVKNRCCAMAGEERGGRRGSTSPWENGEATRSEVEAAWALGQIELSTGGNACLS